MPYICLTQSIPGGTVQILDLFPNTSQANPSLEPYPQTLYVNAPQNDPIVINSNGTLGTTVAKGLSAYLFDRVGPGSASFYTASVTFLAGGVATETITIGTGGSHVVFTAEDAPVAASQQFQDETTAGTPSAAAATFVTTVNAPASQALFATLIGAGAGVHAVAVGAVVTLTVTGISGVAGAQALSTSAPSHYTLSGAAFTPPAGIPTVWTAATLATASASILAAMDAGSAMTLSAVNAILAVVGANLTGGSGSLSTGVLTDLLSILAGRGYQISRSPQTLAPATLYQPSLTWSLTPTVYQTGGTVWAPRGASGSGGFTYTVLTNGNVMLSGEWRPSVVGGDPTQVEFRPIRTIAVTDSLQISLMTGELAAYTQQTFPMAPPVTLWPDSSQTPFFPWTYQPGPQKAQVSDVRVITVYNSDGSVLS